MEMGVFAPFRSKQKTVIAVKVFKVDATQNTYSIRTIRKALLDQAY